ncbi:MAG: hypothetical protein ACI8QD_002547 [Cyclobacteriaceae bacterium]|jgi:hypothetical protein
MSVMMYFIYCGFECYLSALRYDDLDKTSKFEWIGGRMRRAHVQGNQAVNCGVEHLLFNWSPLQDLLNQCYFLLRSNA